MKFLVLLSLAVAVSAIRVQVSSQAYQEAVKEASRIEKIIASKNHHLVGQLLANGFTYKSCDKIVGRKAVLKYLRRLTEGTVYRTTVIAAKYRNHGKQLQYTIVWKVGKQISTFKVLVERRDSGAILLNVTHAGCKSRVNSKSLSLFAASS